MIFTYLIAFAPIKSLFRVIAQDEQIHRLCVGSEPAKSVGAVCLGSACLWIGNDAIMRAAEMRLGLKFFETCYSRMYNRKSSTFFGSYLCAQGQNTPRLQTCAKMVSHRRTRAIPRRSTGRSVQRVSAHTNSNDSLVAW